MNNTETFLKQIAVELRNLNANLQCITKTMTEDRLELVKMELERAKMDYYNSNLLNLQNLHHTIKEDGNE